MRVSAVLLAAGQGRRMSAGINKIRVELAGQPLLAWALRAFAVSRRIQELIVVCQPADRPAFEQIAGAVIPEGATRFVDGGLLRHDSSLAGVRAACGDIVLVHDSARPFPSLQLIDRIIRATEIHGAAVPGLPVVDTVRYQSEAGMLVPGDVPRDRLLRMQTPQGFVRSVLLSALVDGRPATDDAGAVLAVGQPVAVVAGEETNLKVTTPKDLIHAQHILTQIGDRIPSPWPDGSRNVAGSPNER